MKKENPSLKVIMNWFIASLDLLFYILNILTVISTIGSKLEITTHSKAKQLTLPLALLRNLLVNIENSRYEHLDGVQIVTNQSPQLVLAWVASLSHLLGKTNVELCGKVETKRYLLAQDSLGFFLNKWFCLIHTGSSSELFAYGRKYKKIRNIHGYY